MTPDSPVYSCPSCGMGVLKPTRTTYVRRWEGRLLMLPNFAAWRCDSCSYTRYDSTALARVELLLGPDEDAWDEETYVRHRPASGPDERGPRRHTF